MQRDKRKVESGLKTKGFQPKEGDHHQFHYRTLAGKITTIRTKTSHSKACKTLDNNLLRLMAGQCHLQKSEFLDLIDCPMDQAKFEDLIETRKPELLKV